MHASTHRAYCLPFCSVHAVCGPHPRVKPLILLQPVLVHSLTMKLGDCPEPNLNLFIEAHYQLAPIHFQLSPASCKQFRNCSQECGI